MPWSLKMLFEHDINIYNIKKELIRQNRLMKINYIFIMLNIFLLSNEIKKIKNNNEVTKVKSKIIKDTEKSRKDLENFCDKYFDFNKKSEGE